MIGNHQIFASLHSICLEKIMAEKVTFGISKKIFLMVLIVFFLPLGTILSFGHQAVTTLITDQGIQQLETINDKQVSIVDSWMDMNERMLLQNSSLGEVQSMESLYQTGVLKTIAKYYDWSYLVFTLDPLGNNIARSDDKNLGYYGDAPFFQQVAQGKHFGRQIITGTGSSGPVMVLATGIVDITGQLLGVLAQELALVEMTGGIVSEKIGRSGFTFLLDQNGQVVAHPDPKIAKARLNLSKHAALIAMKKGQSVTIAEEPDGQRVVSVARKTKSGFIVISQQNYTEAYEFLASQYKKALVIVAAALLVMLICVMLVVRWVTSPIRKLADVAEQYSQGQLDLEISGLGRKDEIGMLSRSIERLGTSVRLAMKRLDKNRE
jgi:methyl-accepting chemotaxis protein